MLISWKQGFLSLNKRDKLCFLWLTILMLLFFSGDSACKTSGGKLVEEKKAVSFLSGEAALRKKNYREAVGIFEELLARNEGDDESYTDSLNYNFSLACLACGDFGSLSKIKSSNKKVQEIIEKGKRYSRIGPDTPIEMVRAALSDCKASETFLRLSIKDYISNGNYLEAENELERLIKFHGERNEFLGYKAQVLFLQGHYSAGISYLNQLGGKEASLARVISSSIQDFKKVHKIPEGSEKISLMQKLHAKISNEKNMDPFNPSIFTELHLNVLNELSLSMVKSRSSESIHYARRVIELRRGKETERERYIYCLSMVLSGDTESAKKYQEKFFQRGSKYFSPIVEYIQAYTEIKKREQEEKEKEEEEKEKEEQGPEDPRDPEGYYKFFKVPPGSDIKTIEKSYGKIIRENHPARCSKLSEHGKKRAAKNMTKANKAMSFFRNKEKKREYDSGKYISEREMNRRAQQNSGARYMGSPEMNEEIIKMFFGGGFGGGGGGGSRFYNSGGSRTVYFF